MNIDYIQSELDEFLLYHKNYINRIIHVLTGIIYVSCLNILFYKGRFLIIYFIILLFTFPSIISSLLSITLIYVTSQIILKFKTTPFFSYILISIFVICCFIVPEISHYITNEETVINIQSPFTKIVTNIFYFLPFSITSLIINKVK
jgi:hypothetical protein